MKENAWMPLRRRIKERQIEEYVKLLQKQFSEAETGYNLRVSVKDEWYDFTLLNNRQREFKIFFIQKDDYVIHFWGYISSIRLNNISSMNEFICESIDRDAFIQQLESILQ